jgi:hypothetical protein
MQHNECSLGPVKTKVYDNCTWVLTFDNKTQYRDENQMVVWHHT